MKLHFLLPTIKGIPVLMYHRIMPEEKNGLTVTTEQLREQWNYLKVNGYKTLSLEQYFERLTGKIKSNDKEVLLTFDDGYRNNLIYMKPIQEEFDFQVTIFIIADALVKTGNHTYDDLMTVDDLKTFNSQKVTFALHGFHHENFKETDIEVLKKSILKCKATFEENNLLYYPAIAYPFGARPKSEKFLTLKTWMKNQGIKMAFRIGNKPSIIPSDKVYEIKRIDIRGSDTLTDFMIKLKKGKLKPF